MKSSKNKNIWKNLDVVLAVLLAFLGAILRPSSNRYPQITAYNYENLSCDSINENES